VARVKEMREAFRKEAASSGKKEYVIPLSPSIALILFRLLISVAGPADPVRLATPPFSLTYTSTG
jgi:hypothetical protein